MSVETVEIGIDSEVKTATRVDIYLSLQERLILVEIAKIKNTNFVDFVQAFCNSEIQSFLSENTQKDREPEMAEMKKSLETYYGIKL